jgi:hypothetical protein
VSSIDEASGSLSGNAEQARELAASIAASKDLLDSLIGSLSALGMEAKASQAQATSESAEQVTAQVNGIAETLDSLRAQTEALKGLLTAHAGGAGEAGNLPSTAGPSPRSPAARMSITKPAHTPDPSRRPRGPATALDGEKTRSLERENESAIVLARAGYDVEQNPPSSSTKRPDYRIQGEVWDCYAPQGSNVKTIRAGMRKKVRGEQAARIILNLDDCGASPAEIRACLQRDPIRGLEEIKIIENGEVKQFYPWHSEGARDGD